MPSRIDIQIPADLVTEYRAGRISASELSERFGVSEGVILRTLRSLGVETSSQTRKRGKFAFEVEQRHDLPLGSAYTTVVELYRQGLGTQTIGIRLGIASGAVAVILVRMGVRLRSMYCRSVFDDRMDRLPSFAERLRAVRRSIGLTQYQLAARMGVCQATVWHLESCRNGPHWETLFKLCSALEVEPASFGIDWEPAWLEDDSAEDALRQESMEHTPFSGPAFNYTFNGHLKLIEPMAEFLANMVYDRQASTLKTESPSFSSTLH
jgi:transcriptional regulator with XRE-family HTH domain